MQARLITFQRQHVVAALLDDLLGDLALAVERVHGNDAALERQHLRQSWYGGDLIGLSVGGDLRQHQAVLAAPGRDHVQRRVCRRPEYADVRVEVSLSGGDRADEVGIV
jgi:hypothetical protein